MNLKFLHNLLSSKEKAKRQPLLVVLKQLNLTQWALVFSGWLAHGSDAIDFYSVALSITRLTKEFGKSTTDLTASITLTLLFRSLGALVFGIVSDRYGRKWPLVFNLLLCSALQLGSGFAQTYRQFLALRSLFGIAMGGTWGLAVSTGLENIPVEARGFASGVIQQAYAAGCLIAAVVTLGLVPQTRYTWRALFWFGAAISFVAAIFRACLPESEVFLRARTARANYEARKGHRAVPSKARVFLHETKSMLRIHWLRFIYASLLATFLNFTGRGFQDLYPTFLQQTKLLSAHDTTVAIIIGNTGACVGCVIAGHISQYIGRRLTMIGCVCLVLAFVPFWLLPSGLGGLAAGAFCLQFCLQGVWGIMPIFLSEISPPAFRATFPGLAYQLGTMAPSTSAQIESVAGDHWKTMARGRVVPNYAKISGILVGVSAACLIVMTVLGPENHGSEFEKHKVAFEEGGGEDDACVQQEVLSTSREHEKGEIQDEKETKVESDRIDECPELETGQIGNIRRQRSSPGCRRPCDEEREQRTQSTKSTENISEDDYV